MLSPENYGTFNALFSSIMLAITSITPLSMTTTRFFSEYITKKEISIVKIIFTKIIVILIFIAVILFLVFSFTSHFIAGFFKTQSIYILLCCAIIVLSLFSKTFLSLLSSFQKFKIFSFAWASSSFVKMIIGSVFMYCGLGILGGLVGFLIEPLLIILIASIFLYYIFHNEICITNEKKPIAVNLFPMFKFFFLAFLSMLSLALLTNIDVILVKHFYSPLDAGNYSIAQIVAKIAFLLPSALTIVIIPKSTEALVHNKSSFKILYKSLIFAGTCCVFITLLSFLFPDFILRILTGKTNPISSSLVGLFSLSMSFCSLLWITIYFSLATHNFKFIAPLLFIAISEAVFIYNYHPSLKGVILILLFFSFLSFFTTFFMAKSNKNNYAQTPERI